MASFVILWSIIFLANLKINSGLKCYNCTSYDPLSDCVIHDGPLVDCSTKYCMLNRIEADDGSEGFYFIRSCTSVIQPPSIVNNSNTYGLKYYFQYCSTNRCNRGNGTTSKLPPQILVVNGKDNSAAGYLSVNIFLLSILTLYHLMLL
ncbi:uncharacterized protein [Chelonus insularis]|uniref:uncharacterized protein n=1 Tax=Chelonus insularis TaxID=460826 RepID=UPI00158BA33B|nr:uncharacterized protein LOC118063723 [Chelonus insularis]